MTASLIVDQTNRATGSGEVVSYDATTANTTAFPAGTRNVRVVLTTHGYVAIGTTPVATSASFFLPAYVVEYFTCVAGEKVAVLKVADAGTAYVSPTA